MNTIVGSDPKESNINSNEANKMIENVGDNANMGYNHSYDHVSNNQDELYSNDENNSNQVRVRMKKNTLISSKRPKLLYKSSKKSKVKRIIKQTIAKPVKLHTCEICKKTFTRKFHLTRHQTTTSCNENSPQFMCDICGKTYTRNDNLFEHIRVHAGEEVRKRNYKCSICGKAFHGESLLKIHNRVHTGERPYKCQHCEKKFTSQSALTKHNRVHTGEKPFKCSVSFCEMSFSLKGTLNRHILTHKDQKKPFFCEYCHKRFIQKSNLKAHLFYHTGENGFKCLTCGRIFNRKATLQMHIKFIHEKDKSFTCTRCTKNFVRKEDLQLHLASFHSNKNKPFQCEICGQKFSLKPSLKIHKMTHNLIQPIKCSFCHKEFLSQYFLDKHNNLEHYIRQPDNSPNPSTSRAIDIETDAHKSTSFNGDNSVEISLSDEEFNETLRKLLTILIDPALLNSIGWSNVQFDSIGLNGILESLIKKCGYDSIKNKELDRQNLLRENLRFLFTIFEDENVKNYLDNYSIEDFMICLNGLGN